MPPHSNVRVRSAPLLPGMVWRISVKSDSTIVLNPAPWKQPMTCFTGLAHALLQRPPMHPCSGQEQSAEVVCV